MGRLGCDAPVSLVRYMTHLFNQVNAGQKIDYITLNGDIVGHKISADIPADPGNPSQAEAEAVSKHYQVLKTTHALAQQIFSEAFPNTPVFITFGNNDAKYHDQPSFLMDDAEFYGFMYDLWFVNHAPNRAYQS